MHDQPQPERMNFVPPIANSNYGNDLKHEEDHTCEGTDIHNVPIVIHLTAELSVALLNPDLILQGKEFGTDLGSAFESNS